MKDAAVVAFIAAVILSGASPLAAGVVVLAVFAIWLVCR